MNFSVRAINFPAGATLWGMTWEVGTVRQRSGDLPLTAVYTFLNALAGPGTLYLIAMSSPGVPVGGMRTISNFNPLDGSWWEYDFGANAIYEVAPPPPPPIQFTVAISVMGMGTTSPVPGSYVVDEGTLLPVSAIPDTGWQFDGWTGDLLSSANPLLLTVTSNLNIVANFSQIPPSPTYTVIISVLGMGSTAPAPGIYVVNEGTVLPIQATPAAAWEFTRWDGSLPSTANPLIVTVSSDLALIAVFTELPPPPPPTGMTLVADITTEETAVGLVEYGGDLYVAVHTNPKNGLPGTIVRYNDLTGVFGVAFSLPGGQGIGDIRVIQGKLYVTSIDSGGIYGELYVYDGSTWQQVTTSPQAASGLFDIEFYNNRFYVAGYDGGIPKLYSSPDGVTGWALDYSFPGYLNRFTQAIVFQGKLFFTPQSSNEPGPMDFPYDIFSYDGATFTPIKFTTRPIQITDMVVFNNALYLSIWNPGTDVPGMFRTLDGVNFEVVPYFGPSPTKAPSLLDLLVYGNKLLAAEYVPGSVLIYESTDGINWTQTLSAPATDSVYGTNAWLSHAALGVYGGRLYVMPPAEGKLYVGETLLPPVTRLVTIQATVGGTTSPAPGTYTYAQGDLASITATPDADYQFQEWQDGLGNIVSTANPYSFLINTDTTLVAVFALLPPQYTVAISVQGQGSTNPAPGFYLVDVGNVISILAIPSAGGEFLRWEYDGLTSTQSPLVLQVNQDYSILASFTGKPSRLPFVVLAGAAAGFVVLAILKRGNR